jgi:hypothetical protein
MAEPGDPLDYFGVGQPRPLEPVVPPWAVPFGLQPPYPGGSFDEYLDPASRHYRPDVVAALTEHRKRHEQAQEGARIAREQEAASFRARIAAVETAIDPFARAAALVQVNAAYVGAAELTWETWRRLRATGELRPTYDLVRLRIKMPLLRPRFEELERLPAWRSGDRDAYVDEHDVVWEPRHGQQPFRWDDEPWFAVPAGEAVRASVASHSRSGHRYTAIAGQALTECTAEWRHQVVLGVIEDIVAKR